MKSEETDLFNLASVEREGNDEPPSLSPPDTLKESDEPPPKRWFGLGLKEVLILALCVILGAVYLFWPPAPVQPSAARFAPAEPNAWNSAYPKTDPAGGAMPLVDDPRTRSAAAETVTTFKKEMATILEARRHFAEENREGVNAVSARLDTVNQQLKQLEHQLSNLAIRLESVRTQPAVSTPPVPAPVKKRTPRPSGISTAGYQIHTLGQGLAWISYQGSTYAVREGDTLGKLTIKRIDALRRQVETSAGLIR
ncbi:conjugal transfer protein TraP [Candidatus Regiella endosymbiont of Tuberolachnus salignus]|uniref:conjugal transfer protein TraP n=1 Tax=Candidatus Regiella endosymbiont of Tuberolachnus salignus TaxID=3077956 RepID=UPI0030D04BA3